MRVLIDMDGVLSFFVHGAAALWDLTPDDLYPHWDPGSYDMEPLLTKATGAAQPITPAQFWRPINDTPGFWRNLPKLPWADELVRFVRGLTEDFWIVTSPSRCPGCIREKEEWVEAHFEVPHWRVVPTGQKHLLAKPGVLLIDDSDANVEKFRAEGGAAVLFPALHNAGHPFRADPMAVVVPRVTRYAARKH